MGATNKFYQVKKTIKGVEYTAQFNGLSASIRAIDNSYIDGSSNISIEKLGQYVFDNVIVDPPGLTIDDFDSMEDFNEVVKWGRDVMQGLFRDQRIDKASGAKAKS